MFDWDDQELANILWGESGEPDDHIVPYPEQTEKQPLPVTVDHGKRDLNVEDGNSEAAGQQTHDSESNPNGGELDRDDNIYCARGSKDTQHAMSVVSGLKTDENVVETTGLQHGHEYPQSQCEDEGLSELVDNSWAHIGSFDDLERLFSNDDDLVVHSNLGSTDELWSLSKDIIEDADKSSSLALDSATWEKALGNASADFDLTNDCFSYESASFASAHGMVDYSTSYAQQSIFANLDQGGHATGTAIPALRDKPMTVESDPSAGKHVTTDKFSDKNRSKSKSKHWRKTSKERDQGATPGNWHRPAVHIPQFDGHVVPPVVQNYSPYVLTQKGLPHGSALPYQRFPDQYVAANSHLYGNLNNQYAILSLVRSTDDEHQSVLSSPDGDVVSLNRSTERSVRPLNMTPQEKIEKLRRRQKIHAMLAIQKQQQQLKNKVSTAISVTRECAPEGQGIHMEKSSISLEENLSMPCSDINSPLKWDETNHSSVEEDGNKVEDTILQQLHGIVDKLDITIRLCIRDSLFRLAQSAAQRHHVSETSGTNVSSACKPAGEDISGNEGLARIPAAETETNHIDRVVAHLLFHRPFKFSMKSSALPASSSTKFPTEQQTDTSSQRLGHSSHSSKHQHKTSPKGSKRASPATELHQEDNNAEFLQTDATTNRNMKGKTMEHEN